MDTQQPKRPIAGITPQVQNLLNTLHARSLVQENAIPKDEMEAVRAKFASDFDGGKAAMDAMMLDKFIALDEDKCHFMHSLILSTGATTVVEVGTSFGVSTIYLAAAVATNLERAKGGSGVVIGTEKEASKAAIARDYWKAAGPKIEDLIQLKEGDLKQTLGDELDLAGSAVDFVLLDIWPYVAAPALKLLQPRLRPGAVILTDNTISSGARYQDLFNIIRDPAGPFQSITLPFSGGFEMSVYRP